MKNNSIRSSLLLVIIALLLVGCGVAKTRLVITIEKSCVDSRYITLTNPGIYKRVLRGWELHENKRYDLPDIVIPAKSSVNIWSGTGTNDSQNIFIGRKELVWDVGNMYLEKTGRGFLGTSDFEVYFFGVGICGVNP
jgi:hypothetical protein